MSKIFDIQGLSAELGVDGNRKPVDVAETNNILHDLSLFKTGESPLVITPTGSVHATKSENFKAFEKANPEMAAAMPQINKQFRSF